MALRRCLMCEKIYDSQIREECCGMSVLCIVKPKPVLIVVNEIIEEKVIMPEKPLSKRKLLILAREERKNQPKKKRKTKHKLDKELREQILRRDKYKCTKCKERSFLHVHHIVYQESGGTDDPRNLTTLCELCHADAHINDPVYNIMRKGIV